MVTALFTYPIAFFGTVLRDGHFVLRDGRFETALARLLNALLRMKDCVRSAKYSFILRRG